MTADFAPSAALSAVVDVVRLHGPRDVRVAQEPRADPGRDEVRLRVSAVGLCGSDLHWYEGASIGDARLQNPLVLGHEFVGVIADGPDRGMRVAADPADPCGTCDPCHRGLENLCTRMRFAGHGTTDGALRSEMPWPVRLLHPIPEAIPDDEAVLFEPLGIGLHAIDLGQLQPRASVGVYGCGPIGLLLIAALRDAGASRIVATDRLPHRVAAATVLGATEARFAADPKEAFEFARGDDVDVAFEAGGTDDALADAIAATRPGGRVVLVGIPTDDQSSFPAAVGRRKELTLLLCRRMRSADLTRAIRLAAEGRVDLAPIVSHRYPIARANEAFATLASRVGLKVIINPS